MSAKLNEDTLIKSCQKPQGESCSTTEPVNFLAEQNDDLQTDESQHANDLLISSVILFIIFLLVIRTNARHS